MVVPPNLSRGSSRIALRLSGKAVRLEELRALSQSSME
jgi:hypothetical protein